MKVDKIKQKLKNKEPVEIKGEIAGIPSTLKLSMTDKTTETVVKGVMKEYDIVKIELYFGYNTTPTHTEEISIRDILTTILSNNYNFTDNGVTYPFIVKA